MNSVSDDGKVDFSFHSDDLNGNDETRCKLVTDSEWKNFEAEQKKSHEMLLDLYKGILITFLTQNVNFISPQLPLGPKDMDTFYYFSCCIDILSSVSFLFLYTHYKLYMCFFHVCMWHSIYFLFLADRENDVLQKTYIPAPSYLVSKVNCYFFIYKIFISMSFIINK